MVCNIFLVYFEQNGYCKMFECFVILVEIYNYLGYFDIELFYIKMKNYNYWVLCVMLYNIIELLLVCNLVRKYQFGKNIVQFEKLYGFKQYDYVILIDIGEVIEFCDLCI